MKQDSPRHGRGVNADLGGFSQGGLGKDASPKPGRTGQSLRVAMVFPTWHMSGQKIPDASVFAGEDVDFVLFPLCHIETSEASRMRRLRQLSSDLGVPVLVGVQYPGQRTADVLLRFDPDSPRATPICPAHSYAGIIAFQMLDWDPDNMLPTFELCGTRAGATINRDLYLGLLQGHLARKGARLWLNPSGNEISEAKWSAILRLRAVENRLFALCTPMHHERLPVTHPFAFSPDGEELHARRAGSADVRPISECTEFQAVYMVELDMSSAGSPLDLSKLPRAAADPKPGKNIREPVRVSVRDGRLAVYAGGSWRSSRGGFGGGDGGGGDGDGGDYRVRTEYGEAYVGAVRGEDILDAAACVRIVYNAHDAGCRPIIWNHWDRALAEPDRLANVLLGRTIECCAPIVISDKTGIRELVELSNRNKIPARRVVEPSEATIDLERARGLQSAFRVATDRRFADDKRIILARYRSML